MNGTARWLRILCGLAVVAGQVQAQSAAWAVSATPMLVIGADPANSDAALAGVMGARRLADGHLLIADSNPPQLRVFDANGKFVARVGRRGPGPGEFRGRLSMFVAPGDSVLVFDDVTTRWTLYSPTAKLVRSWAGAPLAGATTEPIDYHRNLIHPAGHPAAGCYRPLLDRLPALKDTAYREVFPDSVDRAWIRDERSSTWTVYSLTGAVLGRVTLASDLDLLQIGDGFVVGSRRDRDGVQRIEVRGVRMPNHGAAPPCASSPVAFPARSIAAVGNLRVNLRNLESAGAAFRADYGHYPATFDSLQRASGFQLAPDTETHWIAREGESWDAVSRNLGDTHFCRILIGDRSPTWLYRFPFCGP